MNLTQWSDLPLVLTSEQAAAVLQLKRRTVANMLDRGDLHGVKIGKEWRISRAELQRFLENGSAKVRGKTPLADEPIPALADKGGVLVVQATPTQDLAEFVAREHHQRVAELLQQAGL